MAVSALDRYRNLLQNENIRRTLNTISWAEGTSGPEGYRTMFGGGKFDTSGGWRHPDTVVHGGGYSSAAAGKYQFMPDTWSGVSSRLGLKDFSPESQDIGALAKIEERGVNLDELAKGGLTAGHIDKLAPEWASLPTSSGKSYYNQPVKSLAELQRVYGGEIGGSSLGGGATGGAGATGGGAGGAGGADDGGSPEPFSPSRSVDLPKPATPSGFSSSEAIAPPASLLPGPRSLPGFDPNAPGSGALPSGRRPAGSSFVKKMLQMLLA